MSTGRLRRPRRRLCIQPVVEGLESRRLLAVTFTSYEIPNGATPNSIAVGPDHNLWFTIPSESLNVPQNAAVGVINASTGVVTEYPRPTHGTNQFPSSIVSGPGGNLWFLDGALGFNNIASINPATGAINDYRLTTPGAFPLGLAVGSDGNLWFTDAGTNAIGTFNPTTHATNEFPLPNNAINPGAITPGPDGHLWFTSYVPAATDFAIGDIDPTTHTITLTELPRIYEVPVSITAGPDGNVWFNEQLGMRRFLATYNIASISTSTHAITEYTGGNSGGITTGPDGNLYYDGEGDTESQGMLGEFNPTTLASSTFSLPDRVRVPLSGPTIVTGPDINLWVAAQSYLISVQIIRSDQAAITGSVNQDPLGVGQIDVLPVSQTAYLDLNGNSTLDPGELTTQTDARGNYAFTGLTPGAYTVRIAPYPGNFVTFPAAGSQTVTVVAGQVATAGSIGVVPSSVLTPLFYSPNPLGTSNPDIQTAEVNGLYRTILGRAPDPTGGAKAVAYLKGGGTLAQLSGDLLTSVEYEINAVNTFYRTDLNRAPTSDELASELAFLEGGGTLNQLSAMLLDSPEFSTLYATDTAFVEQLYIDILGRSARSFEVPFWLNELSGGMTRSEVVALFFKSDESIGRGINGLYDLILGHPADLTAINNGMIEIRGGASLVNLAVAYFSSFEYILRAYRSIA